MESQKSKRRCLRSSTERQRSPMSAATGYSAQAPSPTIRCEDSKEEDSTSIMNRSINIHLQYIPPPSLCIDSDTMIQSATTEDLRKYTDVQECPICFDTFGDSSNHDIVATPCQHYFHRQCLLDSLHHSTKCPVCRKSLAAPRGKCPEATMTVKVTNAYNQVHGITPQVIQINYSIPSGTQASYHESPGQRFSGASRIAYLQNDAESRLLLNRLCFAFMHGLCFTVGTSLTSGAQNTVTWASVHHKTSLGGYSFSLPDPGYILNCNEELDNLNVPSSDNCGSYF